MELEQLELDLCDTEEALYWHTLWSFCELVPKYGIDQIINDMSKIVNKEM